ncbi:MAG: hypothetical protein LLG44_14335 [Chloroflexi bacterium]|nr:hypothetical protein [Chloroflexota bacterium]
MINQIESLAQINTTASGSWRKRSSPQPGYVILLVIAVIFHASLLVSWRTGLWNRYTFDTTATHGRKGWDFYALYQAGNNALHGLNLYETDSSVIRVVVPVSTPYRYLPLPALTLGILLNLVTPVTALWIWAIFLELLLLYCCLRSWRLASTANEGVILVIFWLLYTPYYLELYMGQFTLVQTVFVFMLCWQTRPVSDIKYDLIWLASLLWKQMTALYLPLWVFWRRWRGLVIVGLGILITTLPYFLIYPASWSVFSRNFSISTGAQLGNLGVLQLVYAAAASIQPELSPAQVLTILYGWVVVVIVISLWSSFRAREQAGLWHIALWTTTFFLVYRDIWEHHYVLLLPVFVMLYHTKRSPVLLIIYALIALWTPYRLIDPDGLAAYNMSMRWIPLAPSWLNVIYHSCKALPAIALWVYIISQMPHQADVYAAATG